ncbi:MAG: hypothetical protein ACRCZK_02185 [Oscillospiraceae bacterium]
MIKGVSKKIIEVNGNDEDFFEKVILFVKTDNILQDKVQIRNQTKRYMEKIKDNGENKVKESNDNVWYYLFFLFLGSFISWAIVLMFFL